MEPGCFRPLTQCLTIHLNENQLTEVSPDTWEGLESLESLHLDLNRINRLQTGAFVSPRNRTTNLKSLPSLRRLSLTENDLDVIESGAFSGLENLQELFITIKDCTEIEPGAWDGLITLQWFSAPSGGIRNVT